MKLDRNFEEFIRFLSGNAVRYLAVGGYAVAVHGHPRYTKDLDIWIDATPANVARLLAALRDFGFGELGLSERDFTTAGQVVQLGDPPHRIDLLTSLLGVDFETCYGTRYQVKLGDTMIDFIDLDNLIKNKLATGRPQDRADVDSLS
ncbi:MAG: hypothetical protein ACRETM_00455 [Stenotrophobium sp.]